MNPTVKDDVYWLTVPREELADQIKTHVTEYRNQCTSTGKGGRWALSVGSYFGQGPDGKLSWTATAAGESGELVQYKVNEYGSYVRHQVVLAIQNRPAGIAKAVNSDVETLRNARIGSQLVEYYFSDPAHAFEDDYVSALRLAMLSDSAYVVQDWDMGRGQDMRPDEKGVMLRTGDLVQRVYPIWNTAFDLGSPTAKLPWYVFSQRVNKFERAAKFVAFKDEILRNSQIKPIPSPLIVRDVPDDSDFIEEHLLIAFPSDALPEGRYALLINDTIVMDGAFPYTSSNVYRIAEQDMVDTADGFTSNYDLLGLEQVTDCLHSAILNNVSTFSVQTIIGPTGSGAIQTEWAKGLRYVEVEPQFIDKIKPLQLLSTPPEVFKYEELISGKKGELSGINSILRGDPQGALKGASGSAMALLQSQALTYNGGTQRAFYKLISAAGTGIIERSRQFASEPRVARIAGKSNAQSVKEFKYDSSTLSSISTVVFEPVNPVLQTAAGKLSIADALLEKGLINDPQKYVEVLTTGNLNVLLEASVLLEESILAENEELQDGGTVQAIIIEQHKKHIDGHQSVIAMPNAKRDPNLVQRVQAHIQQHIDLWTNASQTNPGILFATGQSPIPMAPPPGAIPGSGAPPPGVASAPAGAPSGIPPHPGGAPQVLNPASNQPGQPNLPQPPKNPLTHEPAPVAAGTNVRHAA